MIVQKRWPGLARVPSAVRTHRNMKVNEGCSRPDVLTQSCNAAQVRRRWEEPEEQTRSRMKRVFGIGPKDFASPSSRLIYPLSQFAVTWMGITCVCLLYTAIVTPAVISFHWLDEPCDVVPTLPIDCVLDVYFLLDIAVNFCSGVIVRGQVTANQVSAHGVVTV